MQEIKRATYNLLYAYGKAVNHKDKPLCIIQYEIDKLGFVEVYAIMKKIKFIILEILFLVVMLLCATTTMKILDILFKSLNLQFVDMT